MTRLATTTERRVGISPWQAVRLEKLPSAPAYDAILASVGYEPRSRAIAAALGSRPEHAVAVEFPRQHTPDYLESFEWFRGEGFELNQEWEPAFVSFVRKWLTKIAMEKGGARVLVDVGSMYRPRIAGVVQALAELDPSVSLEVDLLYAPARFRPPGDLPAGVLSLAPVSSFFSGQLHAQRAPVALVGLGYEPYKAAGALESLEIRRAITYVPEGFDKRFRPAVIAANTGLLSGHEEPAQVNYLVRDPFECFALLDGQTHALLRNGNAPAIIPLGPKIFALCGCLVAAVHRPSVSVWRASFEHNEPAIPHEADEWVCGLTVTIGPALSLGGED